MYLDDDPGVLVSACLFGDGAGAAVLSRAPRAAARAASMDGGASLTEPAQRDALRFEQRGGMLRNILTRRCRALAAEHAQRVLDDGARARAASTRDDIARLDHACRRARACCERCARALGLDERDLRHSARVLREYGNLSQPVRALRARARRCATARPAGWWWMSSFGAGFSCHGALLEVAA